MAEYELKWSDGKKDSNGNVTISPGYVYSPINKDGDKSLQGLLYGSYYEEWKGKS
jgi:hypothetical protein